MSFQCILLLMSFMVVPAITQVQRNQHKFFISFTKVHSNTKMIADYVIERHKKLSLKECVVKCYLKKDCQTINHNKYSLGCEILNSTSLVTKNILERKSGWTFYEADPATRNTGPICMNLPPCHDSHVCVDTPAGTSKFECKCVERFQGPHCNNYIGPGRYQKTPAGSCSLLRMKYKDIPNGYYWLQTNDKVKRVFCNMHHDEGLGTSKKTAIPSCEWLKENTPDSITDFYWTVDNDTDVLSKKVCVFLIHPGAIGRWSTLYGTKFFDEFVLLEDGTMKNKTEVVGRWSTLYGTKFFDEFVLLEDGTMKNSNDSNKLKPSKEKKIFPYSQGWMMSDHGSPSISDYFRYIPENDTLEHFYYDKDATGTTSYKGLDNFVATGTSTRISMVGRWRTAYTSYKITEIVISADGTILMNGQAYEMFQSDKNEVFPPSQGWMRFDHGLSSISDYFRYEYENDTLEHVYFDKGVTGTTSYKGLDNFLTFGKSMRKSIVGRWAATYTRTTAEFLISEDWTINIDGEYISQIIPSDETEAFPPTNGWMLFYYQIVSKPDYFRYNPDDDTLEHVYYNKKPTNDRTHKGIKGFSAVGTSKRKTMVGKWRVVYSPSKKDDLKIYESGQINTKFGTHKLIPSDNEQVFPSYQGWMLFRYNPTMHEYICYDFKTDTIKHFFFSMTDKRSTEYEGLSGFYAAGISTRN